MSKHDAFTKKARRLTGYDYRLGGMYFITICTQDRYPFFGEVVNGEMVLSDEGQIAHDYWLELEHHWLRLFLGEFIVMPNHVHGIIGLEGTVRNDSVLGDELAVSSNAATGKDEYMTSISPKAGSVSHIIGFYKSICTKMIRSVSTEPFGWQPRFHDRIIRNQPELVHIEKYILSNPVNWQGDRFYKP
ncbi:transposase [Rufibacter sp. XAAS-G3-1]|uniref:transposase n=1 Tax=Rufibacter sp. XAAS-G3-1 TaxID=2729134 RepID=UPI0015E668EE|nr:transposase [Rufibacter sp. XAAS-G3-1]